MKNVLLVSHTTESPGPIDKYYDYLSKKNDVFTIRHPLYLDNNLSSSIGYKSKKINFKIPPLLQYPFEGIVTLFFWRRQIKKTPLIDLALCFDPLCFLHVYLFKKLLRVKKIVYYNLDYSKTRFENKLMNFIYSMVNIFAYKRCNYFFCITKRFVEDLDPKGAYDYKNFYIRHTASVKKAEELPPKKPSSIVFAGTIDYNINFNPVLKALQKLKREGVPFTLDIYGNERKKGVLLKKIRELKLEKNISMKGIVDNKTLVNEILPRYLIGICPYVTRRNHSSPDHAFLGTDLTAKLVEYIGAGLPIITTRLFEAFDKITEHEFGFLVSNTQDCYNAIRALLTDRRLYARYKANTIAFAQNYDDEKVLGPIFRKILG